MSKNTIDSNNLEHQVDQAELERRTMLALEKLNIDEKLSKKVDESVVEAKVNEAIEKEELAFKRKKRNRLIATIIAGVIELALVIVIIGSVSSMLSGQPFWVFGHYFTIVATDSMSPEIQAGDFAIIAEADIMDIEVGDNIVFIADYTFGEIEGQNVVHEVIEIEGTGEDVRFTTKGVNVAIADLSKVTKDNFVGICVYNSAVIGVIYSVMTSYITWIAIIFVIALVFLAKRLMKNEDDGKADSKDG